MNINNIVEKRGNNEMQIHILGLLNSTNDAYILQNILLIWSAALM